MATISFDLDGVLQINPFRPDRPDGIWGEVRRALAPHLKQSDPERAALRLIFEEHLRLLHADQLVACFDWDDLINRVASGLGYPNRFNIAAMVEAACEAEGLISAYPGAHACLSALKDRGHTLVSITNGFWAYQAPVQQKLGLLQFYAGLFTPDRTGFGKPQTGIFRAAESAGPAPYLHVGDVLPHDIAGAKRSGWLGILIVQPGAPAYAPLPPDVEALPPHRRPGAAIEWLQARLKRDRRWSGHPPAELEECMPDAIVQSLDEVPPAVDALLSAESGRPPSQ